MTVTARCAHKEQHDRESTEVSSGGTDMSVSCADHYDAL